MRSMRALRIILWLELIVIAMTAGIEQQRHQPAADHEREYNAEYHRGITSRRHRRTADLRPSARRKPSRGGQDCEQHKEHHYDAQRAPFNTRLGHGQNIGIADAVVSAPSGRR